MNGCPNGVASPARWTDARSIGHPGFDDSSRKKRILPAARADRSSSIDLWPRPFATDGFGPSLRGPVRSRKGRRALGIADVSVSKRRASLWVVEIPCSPRSDESRMAGSVYPGPRSAALVNSPRGQFDARTDRISVSAGSDRLKRLETCRNRKPARRRVCCRCRGVALSNRPPLRRRLGFRGQISAQRVCGLLLHPRPARHDIL